LSTRSLFSTAIFRRRFSSCSALSFPGAILEQGCEDEAKREGTSFEGKSLLILLFLLVRLPNQIRGDKWLCR
jgi:hypothetical protein